MDTRRWERAQELFDEALSLPESRRSEFLDAECAGDEELRRQLGRMVDNSTAADQLLEGVVDQAKVVATESISRPRASLVGTHIGPYRLVSELGQGGMGAVYLAERADETYRGEVAVKLLRDPFASEELHRRFHAERQILAYLDHPHISRLIDGGTTENGMPYVIMEYVEGEPITDYCDRKRLTPTERIELLLEVCDALQYAHRNLVVHRDIKPSNILVTDEGVPKLLDFGIAKLLFAEDAPFTVAQTKTQVRLLTPGYASPEQFLGQPVSTASDVYSMGVVLYELLTGQLPHPARDARSPATGLPTAEPERPSTAVGQIPADGDHDERRRVDPFWARDTEPRLLRRLLAGDLDHITLMALRQEPERRYASVDQLAQDLRRHLSGLPVLARPSSVSYRARKFARRNWRGLMASAALVILISGLVGFYTQRLARERSLAQREASKMRQVSTFMRGLFEISDPNRSKGEVVTARELLDQGAARIDTELASQPEVQAAMMNLIGEVYVSLALFDEAEPQIEKALALRREAGEVSEEVAESLATLARLRGEQGRYELAEDLHRQVFEIRRELHGERDLRTSASLHELASAIAEAGRMAEAEALHRRNLDLRRTIDDDPRAVAGILDSLAASLSEQGRYEEAIELYRQSLALHLETVGRDSLEVATNHSNLANSLRQLRQWEEAAASLRESIRIRRKLLGDNHPTLSTSLNTLGVVLHEHGQLEEAEPLFREALRIRIETLGADHPRVAVPLTGLGAVLRDKGELDEADAVLRRSLELHRLYPEGDPRVAHSLAGLASIRTLAGDHLEAEALLREAHDIRTAALPAEHWRIASTRRLLGECLLAQGRAAEALPLLEQGYEGLLQNFGSDDVRVEHARDALARARARIDQGGSGRPAGGLQ